MTLRFVKTSVLVSEDGLDFSKETAIESEEARQARLARENAANKPLYQQLAEQKQKKQDEFDANAKLYFSAPKGLDEEEYHFLESLNDAKEQAEHLQKEEIEKQLEQFRAARKIEAGEGSNSHFQPKVVIKSDTSAIHNALTLGSSKLPSIKISKRKISEQPNVSTSNKDKSEGNNPQKRQKVASTDVEKSLSTSNINPTGEDNFSKSFDSQINSGLDLLNGYGSDDSSEHNSSL